MPNLISNAWYDEECFILCDCDAEGIYLFLESNENNKPNIGFSFFESYEHKKIKNRKYYYEFISTQEFKDFMKALTPSTRVRFINLYNNYVLYVGWNDDKSYLAVEVHHYNKRGKQDKRPVITLSFEKDKCKELKEELEGWITRHDL